MNNKYKKYALYSLIFIIIILALFFLGRRTAVSPVVQLNEGRNNPASPKEEIKNEPSKEKKITTETVENENIIKVSLVVLDKTYQTQIKENSTVFEMMNKLEKEDTSFNFKYTEHKNMGVFVTEINGSLGKPGEYWIYYINDKKPGVGISKYILTEGDIIKWSQEGI